MLRAYVCKGNACDLPHRKSPPCEPHMRNRRTSVTAFDVARLAEVSQSAVSRAFTPGAAVAESTRQKILDAAKKLGYRPNAIARSLITNRSRIIGVVVSYFDNQFYPLVLELLSKELQLRGYHLLLFCTDSGDADNLMLEILQYQVDGIVMASTTFSSPLARSRRRGHPKEAGQPPATPEVVREDRLEPQWVKWRRNHRGAFPHGESKVGYSASREPPSRSRKRQIHEQSFHRSVVALAPPLRRRH